MANIQQAVDVLQQVAVLPPSMIDQNVGSYTEGVPCCVGAHLANFLGVNDEENSSYLYGAVEWANLMGGNILHAIVLLRQAGACELWHGNPFSDVDWRISVAEVCDNLRKIDKLPSLRGKNFKYLPLNDMDLSDTDLHGSDFYGAAMYGVNFSNSNLSNARLGGVSATDADFTHADLTDTQMCDSVFNRSIFNHATMIRARTAQAEFLKAEFDHTDMSRKTAKDGNFFDADLSKVIWAD